jgi:hypothetical protein
MAISAMERRIVPRARLGQTLWLNKYLDGFPHLAEVVELSEEGMVIRTILEPSSRETTFTLELGIPGSAHRLWLWAECVRRMGTLQALQIRYAELLDRAQIRQLVRWSSA